MSKAVSMTEIAKAAGVAKSTISLALRNDPRISEPVRTRIQEIARQMGYKSNPLVARLMYELRSSRKERYVSTLAMINCTPEQNVRKRLYSVELTCKAVENRAEQLGYVVDSFWLHAPKISIKRLANIFRTRNIQGLIFYPTTHIEVLDFDPEGILWNHFPSVIIGTRQRRPPLTFTVNDHYATGYQLGVRLQELGYQRCGLVLNRWIHERMERRLASGFYASFEQPGHTVPPLFTSDRFGEEGSDESRMELCQWLERYKPDSCVCLNRYVHDWIVALGIRVPEDLGIVFIDLGTVTEGMAGMNQRHDTEGIAAVDALVGQILRRENSLTSVQQGILIESVWQMGESVRKLPST